MLQEEATGRGRKGRWSMVSHGRSVDGEGMRDPWDVEGVGDIAPLSDLFSFMGKCGRFSLSIRVCMKRRYAMFSD